MKKRKNSHSKPVLSWGMKTVICNDEVHIFINKLILIIRKRGSHKRSNTSIIDYSVTHGVTNFFKA